MSDAPGRTPPQAPPDPGPGPERERVALRPPRPAVVDQADGMRGNRYDARDAAHPTERPGPPSGGNRAAPLSNDAAPTSSSPAGYQSADQALEPRNEPSPTGEYAAASSPMPGIYQHADQVVAQGARQAGSHYIGARRHATPPTSHEAAEDEDSDMDEGKGDDGGSEPPGAEAPDDAGEESDMDVEDE